jgi:hypothetical protein
MSGTIKAKKFLIHRRFPLLCVLFVFCIVIIAVTSLTKAWPQADEPKRAVPEERADSIAAAMESSLESLPKLYESLSKSIVRVEGKDFTKTISSSETGVIVSPEGHVLVGNGSVVQDLRVHLSDGKKRGDCPWYLQAKAFGLSVSAETHASVSSSSRSTNSNIWCKHRRKRSRASPYLQCFAALLIDRLDVVLVCQANPRSLAPLLRFATSFPLQSHLPCLPCLP